MGKIRKIALLGHGFLGWGGGIDFLKAYLAPLQSLNNTEIYLIIMRQDPSIIQVKNVVRWTFGRHTVDSNVQELENIAEQFEALGVNVIFCNYCCRIDLRRSLKNCIKHNDIDIVFPTLINLGENFPVPWVVYLPDFQHKYYPEFFSKKECLWRDKNFGKILREAQAVIVESEDTKKDIFRYYPNTKARVYVMPYTAIPEKEWLYLDDVNIAKYRLERPFFLVSNQLWMHKSHITAIEALAKLREDGYDIDLVCTGKTEDYRNPNYYNDIKKEIDRLGVTDYIHFLGYIPKLEQIKLLKNSIAAVQPTLFEGNPGGGIAYNAVAMGVPIILSDIPVNLELKSEFAVFFEAKNVDDLAAKMEELILTRSKYKEYTSQQLVQQGKARLQKLSEAVAEIINSLA